MTELSGPFITTSESYLHKKADKKYWEPYIRLLAERHHLSVDHTMTSAGFNGTYPVFVSGSYVFKFFGFRPGAELVFRSECRAHQTLETDPSVLTPKVLHSGSLSEGSSWFYTIATKIEGHSLLDLTLNESEKLLLAGDIGQELAKVHALKCDLPASDRIWHDLDIRGSARKSILPEHLTDQVGNFINSLDPFDKVFVNADIVENHVFLKHGRLSGIIDWGDAAFADRHYELGKLHLNVFDADKKLLTKFLDSANWPVQKNFARQSLGMAFYRQAVGHTQHHSFDVFYKLPEIISLDEIQSLEELSDILFRV